MPGPRPFGGYPSVSAYCLARRNEGASPAVIADEVGITPQAVSSMIYSAAAAIRNRTARVELEKHALNRGITVTELCSLLITVIAKDDLVNAILDDGAGE